MTDILQLSNQIFGDSCSVSCEENLHNLSIECQIAASDLPSQERLADLCNKCLERDNMVIRFHSVEEFIFRNTGILEQREYDDFKTQLEQNDSVDVKISIQKNSTEEIISVYNIEKFSEFLCRQEREANLRLFAMLFAGGKQHICFQVVNCDSYVHTSSIAFAPEPDAVTWDNSRNRVSDIKNCNDSSVFFGRAQYPLVPQDFAFIEHMYDNCYGRIKVLFDKLRNILSYLYVANTSNLVGNTAVLQFDPTVNGYEYTLEQLGVNKSAWDIYSWIHKDEGGIDRAGIVRNIINLYCKTSDEILNIDENIYNSAVANYVIYQKKHTDQYIELKNKLSEFIVESARQLQELAHDLVEGIRNNFVAVIVFLMTVLLTDSIDFSSFTQTSVSSNIVAVCVIFTIVSLLYMIVTIIAGNTKWGWLEKSYNDLKSNYNEVLDERDIQTAVNDDAAFKNTKKEYENVRRTISIIWIIFIIGMAGFTFVIRYNSRSGETSSTKINQSEESVIIPAETDVSETEINSDLSPNIEKGTQENSFQTE